MAATSAPSVWLVTGLWEPAYRSLKYVYLDYWEDAADPRTAHLPLIGGSPNRVVAIVLAYLLFVKLIGPYLMRHRPPFELRAAMMLYNVAMVVANTYFFITVMGSIDYGRKFLDFKFPDQSDRSPRVFHELSVGYLCYLSRFADLLDTVFFVLRKKNSQITFLHLYHHSLVPIIGWMVLKISPQAPVVGLFLMFNTLIHSLMYLYYALAAFGPQIQKYLWWKKYITQMQLFQFGTCFVYGVIMVFLEEGFPVGLFWIGFAQNPVFFYMFYNFYRRAYHKKSPACPQVSLKPQAECKKSL